MRAAAAQFSQVWVNATETHKEEEAVFEAILTKGPMTVSVNAEVSLRGHRCAASCPCHMTPAA